MPDKTPPLNDGPGGPPLIDPQLLEILCCPETKEDVTLITGSRIEDLNRLVAEGRLKNRSGETVRERMEGGLLRADGKYLYPIREGIPIMLIDEAIPLEEVV